MSKAENLMILKNAGINVPDFITVSSGKDIDLSFSKSSEFAVRSSYSAEDGESSSCAGQFTTLLNVRREDVHDAADKVMKSYSSENYLTGDRCKADTLENKVIVQDMIKADYSGVIFTSNPLGIVNEIVIVTGAGLGVNVVEDKINTASYYYNCDDKQYFYTAPENMEPLSSGMISELVENALKIKDIFHRAMDIEFAVRNNILYILQARPITTLNDSQTIVLDNSNITESYPERTLPLTQDFAKEIYYKVFRSCVKRVSGSDKITKRLDSSLQNMVAAADGSLYYRIDNWYALLKLLPFSKKIISIWQKMLGVNSKTIPEEDFNVGIWNKSVIALRFLYFIIKTPNNMARLNEYFREQLPSYQKRITEAETIPELLALYHELIDLISSEWDITLINDMYAFIFTALSGKKHESDLANIRDLKSMKPMIGMNDLIDTARKYTVDSNEYREKKAKYIDEYGDRCLGELKLETKTYRSDPALLDEYVKSSMDREIAAVQMSENEVRDNFFVKRAKLGISNREISRLNRSRIFGLAREIMLKIGQIMEDDSLIGSRADVFYLYENELPEQKDRRQLIKSRKTRYKNYDSIPVFGRLVYSGDIIDHSVLCSSSGVLDDDPDSGLTGIPASMGSAEGEVVVISSPSADIDVSGKIIVTTSTDPGWVFLIKNCIGIIAEKGSMLSHTAIITRELGKPSIVNVKNAARKLKTGDIISMDAVNGRIRVISSRDSKPDAEKG